MSIVYLIGAGPGVPGLITARGMQCLAEADVVLYDHLVHPRLLRYGLLHNLRPLTSRQLTWKYDRRGLTPDYFARVMRELEELRDSAKRITCPVLVIRGAESETLSARDAKSFAGSFPDGRCATVEHAGHTVQGDNPSGLVEALTRFLGEVGHA